LRERRIEIRTIDIGGGLGIRYRDETPPTHQEFATLLMPALREAGVTVVIDGAMNDLIRPSLYGSYHEIIPVDQARQGRERETVDVVGPVCESGDFLAKDRELARVDQEDLLAVMSAGAYGFVMASNYNTRPRAAEVLVDGNRYTIVRRRETYEDLVAGETAP